MPWPWALVMACVLAGYAVVGRWQFPTIRPGVRAFAAEAAIVSVLYALWRLAGQLSLSNTGAALERGRWIWHAERVLHLPSEATVQHAALHAPWLVHAANFYYIGVHVPAMGIFLVWCFVRHRDAYFPWRSRLAMLTLLCLLVQLYLPLAPPRLIGHVGIIDAGLRYGPTVYDAGGGGFADQLSSMPSVHVAWALVVGIGTIRAGQSRWRWIGAVHLTLTVLVVVVTGNHYWLDGVAAGVLLLLVVPVQAAGAWAVRRVKPALERRIGDTGPGRPEAALPAPGASAPVRAAP
jgi:hypothetical protein